MAAATAAALKLFRIHKPSVQHLAWSAVMLSMLVVPLWIIFGIQAKLPVLPPLAGAGPIPNVASSVPASQANFPLPIAQPAATPRSTPQHREPDWRMLLLGIYLVGAITFLARLAVGTLLTVKVIRGAFLQDGQLTSSFCASPATVGIIRSVVVLPVMWTEWPPQQLEAVLLHEREHVRRHDPLIQWLALLNRAVFWFHPLAWWLQQRLAALAEECCDDAVLAGGHDAHDYSAYLLELARSVTNAGYRFLSVGMVAPGDRLLKRVRRICNSSVAAPSSRMKVGLATVSCLLCCAVFSGFGLAHSASPAASLQISASRIPAVIAAPTGASVSAPRVRPEKSSTPVLREPSAGVEATQASQPGPPTVAGIQIMGNRRISSEIIRSYIHITVGDILNRDTVRNDVRALYAMGEFDDIGISTEPQGANSVIVTFTVKEKPPKGPEAQERQILGAPYEFTRLVPSIFRQESVTALPTAASQTVYVIKPKDVLNIVVWKEPVLSGKVAVRPDGRISVPLLQDVSAAGLTPEQLKVELEQRLARFVEHPNVTVIVEEISSYRVYVIGAVQKPGEWLSEMPVTVLQAITMAGGFQDSAADHEIRIIRSDGTDAFKFVLAVSTVSDGSDQPQNKYLKNGDVVFVR
jgi:polysaccharide export outer membrane protein